MFFNIVNTNNLSGGENSSTVPDNVLSGGLGGTKPHLALNLFQGSAVGRSGLHRFDLGLAAGSPVPPADLRQGAVVDMAAFTGAVLEDVPVYSL